MSDWRTEADEIMERARYQRMKILVWGPGDPGPTAPAKKRRAYAKRVQIKEVLEAHFPHSEVYFSEDTHMVQITAGIRGQLRKEALQARAADLVLMLDISRGADLELDYFVPTYAWFREKVYVFLPARFVPPQGLVEEVFDYLREDQVEGFTPHQFNSCQVATQMAVEVAQTVAIDKSLRR